MWCICFFLQLGLVWYRCSNNVICIFWKYVWMKKCVKIRVMLFKNWKHTFKHIYQTTPNIWTSRNNDKSYIKIRIMLFKNWKYVFKHIYQTANNIWTRRNNYKSYITFCMPIPIPVMWSFSFIYSKCVAIRKSRPPNQLFLWSDNSVRMGHNAACTWYFAQGKALHWFAVTFIAVHC